MTRLNFRERDSTVCSSTNSRIGDNSLWSNVCSSNRRRRTWMSYTIIENVFEVNLMWVWPCIVV